MSNENSIASLPVSVKPTVNFGFNLQLSQLTEGLKDNENGWWKEIISVYWFQGDCCTTNLRHTLLETNLFEDIFDIYRFIKNFF